MADRSAAVRRWTQHYPNLFPAIGVSILVLGLSIWLGTAARATHRELTTRRSVWEQTANQLATVRQQFRVPTSTESNALVAESRRLGALAVPPEEKLDLIDSIGRLAEACGLEGIRVTAVAASDSLYRPERNVPGMSIHGASYDLAVEFAGGFAGVVKFVSSLPPSVSISRLLGTRGAELPMYQMVLSVYEVDAAKGD
ncbi:MAG TPA: hypothetical protein VFO55_12595 [Gemmatimonadaceae bacterium]|nr:hypothetical protein [Gemmatimonadaceae bacterium]